MRFKKGQIGMEYLLIVGLVTFVVMGILFVAFTYSNLSKDNIKSNQIEGFARKIIDSAESVFYSGEPSRVTINVYLPENIESIDFIDNNLVLRYNLGSGSNTASFPSKVPISGSISTSSGIKKIRIQANGDFVSIESI
jgi:Tfp pilus assembly protein PilX